MTVTTTIMLALVQAGLACSPASDSVKEFWPEGEGAPVDTHVLVKINGQPESFAVVLLDPDGGEVPARVERVRERWGWRVVPDDLLAPDTRYTIEATPQDGYGYHHGQEIQTATFTTGTDETGAVPVAPEVALVDAEFRPDPEEPTSTCDDDTRDYWDLTLDVRSDGPEAPGYRMLLVVRADDGPDGDVVWTGAAIDGPLALTLPTAGPDDAASCFALVEEDTRGRLSEPSETVCVEVDPFTGGPIACDGCATAAGPGPAAALVGVLALFRRRRGA